MGTLPWGYTVSQKLRQECSEISGEPGKGRFSGIHFSFPTLSCDLYAPALFALTVPQSARPSQPWAMPATIRIPWKDSLLKVQLQIKEQNLPQLLWEVLSWQKTCHEKGRGKALSPISQNGSGTTIGSERRS